MLCLRRSIEFTFSRSRTSSWIPRRKTWSFPFQHPPSLWRIIMSRMTMIHVPHPSPPDLPHVEQSTSALRLEETPVLAAFVPLAEPDAKPSEPVLLPAFRAHESPRPFLSRRVVHRLRGLAAVVACFLACPFYSVRHIASPCLYLVSKNARPRQASSSSSSSSSS